jgi:hypothetical protein
MAGSPLKRARSHGIRLDDGCIFAFPYMPRVGDLPPDWLCFSTADKIKHLLGMSLDQAHDILSWPITEPNPLRRSLQAQVIRVVMKIAAKRFSTAASVAKLLGRANAMRCWRGW